MGYYCLYSLHTYNCHAYLVSTVYCLVYELAAHTGRQWLHSIQPQCNWWINLLGVIFMAIPKDPEKFKEWLSHQTEKCKRKWSNPRRLKEHWDKQGHPQPKGSDSLCWKGDNVKYNSLHLLMRKVKPKLNVCDKCGKKAKRIELANISGIYNRDPDNYFYLCTKCHREFDRHSYKMMRGQAHQLFFNQFYQANSALLPD